jgi:serine phosphatase RsbU (regulator of sigma subunit)
MLHPLPAEGYSQRGLLLDEIASKEHELHSDEIMNQLRSRIVDSLRQKGVEGESQDGMDMALYIIDLDKQTLEFSGANLPLFILRKQELLIVAGDKMPIGISSKLKTPFTRQELKLEKGDILYTFSDGYPDQFGGPRNKKFMIKRFRELLVEIHSKPMRQQKNILQKRLEDWMHESDCEQVDDITVFGVKI